MEPRTRLFGPSRTTVAAEKTTPRLEAATRRPPALVTAEADAPAAPRHSPAPISERASSGLAAALDAYRRLAPRERAQFLALSGLIDSPQAEPTPIAPFRERRNTRRRKIRTQGRILFSGGDASRDVLVVDASPTGRRLSLGNTIGLPPIFDLVTERDGEPQRAEVVWRDLKDIGVRLRR